MTVLTLSPVRPRPLAVLTAAALALLVLTLVWSLSDARLIDGGPVWAKPMKFALSFVVLFGTLALVEARLSPAWRDGWLLRGTVVAMAVAMILEMGYIITQAAQGEASHFNFSTPYNAIMYGTVMAFGAFVLVAGVAVFGVAAARDRAARDRAARDRAARDRAATMGPALRQGVVWGFGLTLVLTLITAFTLGNMEGHFVGVPAPDAATIPLFGWSAAVGDLRPAHFLALHTMQALQLVGLWIDRRGGGAAWQVPAAAVIWVALTLGLFVQGLLGLPLIRL